MLAALLLAVTTFVTACSTQTAADAAPSADVPTPVSSGASAEGDPAIGARAGAGADWSHTLQVVANLRDAPPDEPVVVLFGGSAARESTISDSSWRDQIRKKGGPATAAYNLGSRNRTLAQSVALVDQMPKVPTIVYIGVNLGSFTSPQKTATVSLPAPRTPLPAYRQHTYSQSRILTAAKKKALLQAWLTERYPVFKRNYAGSAGVLAALIEACRDRGMKPVLLELPRNTAIIGHRLDAPIARTRATCRTLAKKYDIPFVSFVAQAKLPNSSFYDLWHLVEPGRRVWQALLSARTATLLEEYGYDGGGS